LIVDRHRQKNTDIVSSDSEELILVDCLDKEIGYLAKDKCHEGTGILHRAFSLFIFNDRGQVLLQQRSAEKRLWPLFWSNSCCSHPRRGETMNQAVQRRLMEELGITCDLVFLYKFIYQATFEDRGSEHEYCWIYVGKSSTKVWENRNEIEDLRYVTPEQLDEDLKTDSVQYTPWLQMEWRSIRQDYGAQIRRL